MQVRGPRQEGEEFESPSKRLKVEDYDLDDDWL